MDPSDNSQDIDYTTGITGPGTRLQAARIDRGLSIVDVANLMHLSAGIIQSIEENDFEAITAPIFVKGYLRAYARIVSLDENELIRQYAESFSDDDPALYTTSAMATEISVEDTRIKWTTLLVIFVLILLLAIWWWNKGQHKADVFSLEALQTDTLTQADILEEAMREEIEAASETSADTTKGAFADQFIDMPQEPTALLKAGELEVGAAPASSESEKVLSEDIQLEQIDYTELAGDSGTIIRLAPIGSDQLLIIVHADTWADIKDSETHQLAYDLLRAGQKLKMTGQAPFAVFLGNGHGVELIYNDESIDVTNRIRDDNTARLKIGN